MESYVDLDSNGFSPEEFADVKLCLETLLSIRAGSQPLDRELGIDFDGIVGYGRCQEYAYFRDYRKSRKIRTESRGCVRRFRWKHRRAVKASRTFYESGGIAKWKT